jgi:hypothetical protein
MLSAHKQSADSQTQQAKMKAWIVKLGIMLMFAFQAEAEAPKLDDTINQSEIILLASIDYKNKFYVIENVLYQDTSVSRTKWKPGEILEVQVRKNEGSSLSNKKEYLFFSERFYPAGFDWKKHPIRQLPVYGDEVSGVSMTSKDLESLVNSLKFDRTLK